VIPYWYKALQEGIISEKGNTLVGTYTIVIRAFDY